MKNSEMVALALAGVALWLIANKSRAAVVTTVAGTNPSAAITPKEIFTGALPGQPGYSWRYFTDGTVIDPSGAYYKDGALVWSPA
jgi:hypothetical protein